MEKNTNESVPRPQSLFALGQGIVVEGKYYSGCMGSARKLRCLETHSHLVHDWSVLTLAPENAVKTFLHGGDVGFCSVPLSRLPWCLFISPCLPLLLHLLLTPLATFFSLHQPLLIGVPKDVASCLNYLYLPVFDILQSTLLPLPEHTPRIT